jgi:hypothetical protein
MNTLKSQYQHAINAKTAIDGLIKSIESTTKFIENKSTETILTNLAVDLNSELSSHEKVIKLVDQKRLDFNQQLITHAMMRVQKLNNEIRLNESFIANKQRDYDQRVQESMALRVQTKDHKPLDTAPTEEDRLFVDQRRIELDKELATMNELLMDGPLFDTSLLAETSLAYLI